MTDPTSLMTPELELAFVRLFSDFFDQAERRRRWNLREDIPWHQCNPALSPAIAAVVESFCGIELYLPDYTAKLIPLVRRSRGRAWFYLNWGYEESKHSMALSEWLLKSRHRTEEQMTDMEGRVFAQEWNLPHDTALGMLTYTMVQEYATWLAYRNLLHRTKSLGGDPALEKVLSLLMIDEATHGSFFRDAYSLFLKHDRDIALNALREVMNHFKMPAIHDLLDNAKVRQQEIMDLDIFNDSIFYGDVYLPLLNKLGIDRNEMRTPRAPKKSARITTA